MPAFNDLLQKFIRDELNRPELDSFLELARDPVHLAAIREAIGQHLHAETFTDLTGGMDLDAQFAQVLEKARNSLPEVLPKPAPRLHFIKRWWAAAAVLILLAAGTWWMFREAPPQKELVQSSLDIAPGKEGAILTLADGSQVVLDSLNNGIIATQNGVQVKLENGQLTYSPASDMLGQATYNTMTTPRGRQFQLLLPDGTRVWLNAASSIQYPTVFAGSERRVTITGEAYFEVAHHKKMPFLVNVNGRATVEVLGTHFNVNAYDEAAIRTTLLEGSVKVKQEAAAILKPGQQASIFRQPASIEVQDADVEKVMAWKNGFFNFEGVSLSEVMKELERWYDITVEYEKDVSNMEFVGEISRNVSLADLVLALKDVGEVSNIHFRIEAGRRLVVFHR